MVILWHYYDDIVELSVVNIKIYLSRYFLIENVGTQHFKISCKYFSSKSCGWFDKYYYHLF